MTTENFVTRFNRIQQHLQELNKEFAEMMTILREEEGSSPASGETPSPVAQDAPSRVSSIPSSNVTRPQTTPSTANVQGQITARQLVKLRELVDEKLGGNKSKFEAGCKSRFGKTVDALTTQEASSLITELIQRDKPRPQAPLPSAKPSEAQ
ncbi:MAG: hypothetical protein CVU65_00155 [Deltaproteobacteria bacterium HGW-Deltaproteobacteria-22]|jgi:hypothetical protein|nr:MAG: hypothetical protein CVU65_00155 [Deltaproteobacteria bacterium HGW-Deltaproteobacteria-22]